jgi:hypothetical protein
MTRRHHDVRGNPAAASPIVQSGKPEEPWKVESTATIWALIGGDDRRIILDEMQHGVKDMRPEDCDAMPYYDRQTLSVTNAMVECGHLTWAEIEDRIQRLRRSRAED